MVTNEDTVLSQYVPGYRANLNLAPMQTDTRLLATVDGDLAYDTPGQMFNGDDIGRSDPEPILTRVPDTPDKFLGQTRRVGYFTGFHDTAWIDNADKARELVDPTNKTMMSLMGGRWRHVDKVIMAAAVGNAYSKTDDSSAPSATALPAGQIVASTDVTAAHDGEVVPTNGSQYGLSVGKILRAGFLLDESELEGPRHWVGGSQQKEDLLRRTPVTSRYYANVTALVEGKVDTFMGFTFHWLASKYVPSAGLGHDTASAIRQNIAYVQDAIMYRGRPIIEAQLWNRKDKSNRVQAYYEMEDGAVRRYDTAVVEIDCYEGAAY